VLLFALCERQGASRRFVNTYLPRSIRS
jgi:hypothetical protein